MNDFFVNLVDMRSEWRRSRRHERIRGTRSRERRTEVDRHPRRPDLRFALAAACPRGSLCVRGADGEVCGRLRGGVDQGDEPGPLQSRLKRGSEAYSDHLQPDRHGTPPFSLESADQSLKRSRVFIPFFIRPRQSLVRSRAKAFRSSGVSISNHCGNSKTGTLRARSFAIV